MTNRWSIGLFLVFQILDVVTTYMLFQIAGTASIEANPIARPILASYGLAGISLFKAASVIFVLLILKALPACSRARALDFLNGMYFITIVMNVLSYISF